MVPKHIQQLRIIYGLKTERDKITRNLFGYFLIMAPWKMEYTLIVQEINSELTHMMQQLETRYGFQNLQLQHGASFPQQE